MRTLQASFLLLLLAGVVFLVAGTAQAALVGYWNLDNNMLDQSGTGNDGTPVGSPAYDADVPPLLGSGQSILLGGPIFDAEDNIIGGDAIDVGNAASLNFSTGDWTISAWVKSTNTGTGDDNKGTIFANGGDTGGGHRYALIVSEDTEGVPMIVTDDDVDKHTQNAATVVNDGSWHHVTALRDVDKINIYVNAIREGSNDFGDAGYDLSGTVQHNAYIGASTDHNDTPPSPNYKYFKGKIDDVALYNERLQGNQIAYLASGGDPTSLPAGIPDSDLLPPPPGPFGPGPGPIVLALQNFDDPGQGFSTQGEGMSENGREFWTASDTEGISFQRSIEVGEQAVFWAGSKGNGDHGGGVDPRILELDPVDVSGLSGVVLNVALAASFAGDWEGDDYLKILADPDAGGAEPAVLLAEFRGEVEGGFGKNLANLADPSIPIKDVFGVHGYYVPEGATDLVIRFEFHSTSDSEIVALDDIMVSVPEPSTLVLLAAGGLLGLVFWRRRRGA